MKIQQKTMEELIGDGDEFIPEDFLCEEDLENHLLEINKTKIWLDTKQSTFSDMKMSKYRFSEYLDKPKQLVELCLNDKWFDFITNYDKNLGNNRIDKNQALTMFKRTLQHEINDLSSGLKMIRLNQEDRERLERWKMIGERLRKL